VIAIYDNEVVFFKEEAFFDYAMEMAIENDFEVISTSGGWGEAIDTVDKDGKRSVDRWKNDCSTVDKMAVSCQIMDSFGKKVFEVKKDELSLIEKQNKKVLFSSVFDVESDFVDSSILGVTISMNITDSNSLAITYLNNDEDLCFSKEYFLPDELGKKVSFGEVIQSPSFDGSTEVELISLDGKKGIATFHFNGEGTLYNDFYIPGNETDDPWDGYFEVEDLFE
jgi:hypothetical protein